MKNLFLNDSVCRERNFDKQGIRRTNSQAGNSCDFRPPLHGFFQESVCNPPKAGGQRPVFNLRQLNQFVKYEHFKMEGIHMLTDLLKPNDFMAKIDLKDAISVGVCFPPRYLYVINDPPCNSVYAAKRLNKRSLLLLLLFGLAGVPESLPKY